MDDEATSEGSVLNGRYELGPLLGQGGMATVRDATDQRLGRRVAVKILRADLAAQPRARARFETEASAAARLVHPNVVTVFDSGEENGIPFLVMERLPGRTFADEIGAGPVAIARVCDVAREILAALTAAHAAGIVHRDIKPANVLVCADGRVKVSDFGIAKTIDDTDQTQTMELLATPGYLAPERIAGEPASARSDLYSVGVLVYEALTGQRPFSGATPVTLMRAIERGEPESLTELRPEVPAALVAVVARSMALEPERRFASAPEMAAALAASTELDETVAIDVPPRDGTTQTLPSPLAVPVAVSPTAAAPARSGRTRSTAVGIAIGAVLAAIVLAVFISQRDPAQPAAPPATVATTTSTPTTAAPTTAAQVVAPTPPPGPANKNDRGPGNGGKGKHKP
jgi:serine/threonine protein kinase